MIYWLAAALLTALGALAAARYLPAPGWVSALYVMGGGIGVASAMMVGLVVRRVRIHRRWIHLGALSLAVGAAVGRAALVSHLEAAPVMRVTIHVTSIVVACSTVFWGLIALIWGSLAVSDALGGRVAWAPLAMGGAAVTAAMYALAPLSMFAGIKVNHWTIIGLFGLSAVAYGVGRLARGVQQRWQRRRPR